MSIVKVANLAGVSKSTVSRVINESSDVAPEKAKIVRDAMRSLGYEPSIRRRGRKSPARRGIRTGNIAMLVMGMRPLDLYRLPVIPALLAGVERSLAEMGFNLILAHLSPSGDLPPAVTSRQADGLLLFGKSPSLPQSIRSSFRQVPAVWIMREHNDSLGQFDHVFYNNASVGRLAARYLLRRGRRRLVYINTDGNHEAFLQRQEDFAATARSEGVHAVQIVTEGETSALRPPPPLQSRFEFIASELARDKARFSPLERIGLFVPNDAQLPGLSHALQAHDGLRLGRDLDVISCDNESQFLSQVSPRPATIDINLELVGRRSVTQLLWRMRHPEETNRISILVEPTLVAGET